ncbi:Uncharacterised protein [Citrobacter freundii]|nr:Uncharacterised protein [Citrobacter freundii]
MLRRFNGDMRIIILIQQRELFFKIGTKKRRTGDRSGVAARMGKTAIGAGFRRIGGASIPSDTKRWVNKKTIMAGRLRQGASLFQCTYQWRYAEL